MNHHPDGLIIDEAQRVPILFSYLQTRVDEARVMGQYVLTGSQQFGLRSGIHPSLAGRVGLLHLLPLSIAELEEAGQRPASLDHLLFQGGYPAIYDQDLPAKMWLPQKVSLFGNGLRP